MDETYRLGYLSELIDFRNGKAVTPSGGDVPIFGGNGVLGYGSDANYGACVIVGRVGAYCGSIHLERTRCWVSDNALAGVPKGDSYNEYNYYLLKALKLNERQIGSSQPLLTQGILNLVQANIEFDTQKQQRISAVLSALDAKIDLNHRINAELEALAKTIYDYWFVQFDFPDAHGRPYKSSGGAMVWNDTLKREIPVGGGWAFGTLGGVIQLVYGKPLKESDRSGTGFPVMGSNGVVGYHKEFLAEGPGIVVGRKGTAGAISYSHENFFPIDTTFYVTPRRDYGFNFLLHLLRSLPLTKLNSDSAVPGLNRDSALRLPVLLPPDDLVKRYDMLASTFEAKLKSALFENRELTQLRDWLLPLLMNGQVRVA